MVWFAFCYRIYRRTDRELSELRDYPRIPTLTNRYLFFHHLRTFIADARQSTIYLPFHFRELRRCSLNYLQLLRWDNDVGVVPNRQIFRIHNSFPVLLQEHGQEIISFLMLFNSDQIRYFHSLSLWAELLLG